jgi:hypothetical protein
MVRRTDAVEQHRGLLVLSRRMIGQDRAAENTGDDERYKSHAIAPDVKLVTGLLTNGVGALDSRP